MTKLKLYNTLTKTAEEVNPIRENLGIYSCGPTVYDRAHIGNFRSFLFADFLVRTAKALGYQNPKWILNITDVDDKTIKKSTNPQLWRSQFGERTESDKENLKLLTSYYLDLFEKDIKKLGINTEDISVMPKATDYIEEMNSLINNIIDNGFAYVANGSVYFDTDKWRKSENYGRLKRIVIEDMIDSDSESQTHKDEKKSPLDFVLWKSKKENEPYWELIVNEEVLEGRPGWHLECSAMSNATLGLPFDIHTGGIDLCFPHHEDELAQSHAAFGVDPVKIWCHNEFLDLDGEKMSKSTGNIWNLEDLEANGISAQEYRYAILAKHYRKKIDFSIEDTKSLSKGRERIQDYVYDLFEVVEKDPETIESDFFLDQIDSLKVEVSSHLADDLNSPRALASVFVFIGNYPTDEYNVTSAKKMIEFFDWLNSVYNVWEINKKPELEFPQEVIELAEKRKEAKASKDWTLADELRNQLTALGYSIKDSKDGFQLNKI
ncbi:MAG: cysteine--tRNA ligase [Candidatus Kapaibacteriales bacterium]